MFVRILQGLFGFLFATNVEGVLALCICNYCGRLDWLVCSPLLWVVKDQDLSVILGPFTLKSRL